MNLLWVFAVVAPLGLASLFAFAARIDPLSGHWRAPSDTLPDDDAMAGFDA
ncbi:hypothetical protein [Caballeronia sp. LZ035]|uniref:hypothetical protein n=1 Tax=Caballeronia sp. LZ035 TaxID=3038568 RepID=UPI00285F1FEC|nr:hypothetical protein [Caballeronia sp. LZ035]MDR5757618.1 hypothetical protein [Caballeronia sp. LZ035]